jgi:hypothetical protein
MSKKDRFNLEQEIQECWNVTTDLSILSEFIDSDISKDMLLNILIGMSEMYDLKFQRMFKTFEEICSAPVHEDELFDPIFDEKLK